MLRSLKILDASENQIIALHPSICDLHQPEMKLELRDNPLQRPPINIARQGIGAIRHAFKESLTNGDLFSYSATMVLLGHADSGKTSLQRGLRAGTACATAEHEATVFMDLQAIPLMPPLHDATKTVDTSKQVSLGIW